MPPTYSYECKGHDGLIYSEYKKTELEVKEDLPGLWKYIDWLPVKKHSTTTSGPVTYRSEALATELGLKNLWISYNGYWPRRKARTLSATFKEYEAVVTLQRMEEFGIEKIVLASAGNTARAFAHISRFYDVEVIAAVPENNLENIWLPQGKPPNFTLISVKGDYYDAIQVAGRICKATGYPSEGGAHNVARRDGMSIVVLDAANTMGEIPKNYFQGIGSGTGGISAHEAALRLARSEKYENDNMRLHLAQNSPFTPIHNAYRRGSKTINKALDMPRASTTVTEVLATMLTNRRPPYSIPGGVYDVLNASKGITYAVTNQEIHEAQDMFKALEGRTIVPEAGAAVAALKMVSSLMILDKEESVLLNITGGSITGVHRDIGVTHPAPKYEVESGISERQLRRLLK
jgi:cysteate synthase